MKDYIFSIMPYIIVPLLVSMVDFITLIRSRFILPDEVTPSDPRNYDFTILVPIFGNTSYLKNLDFLANYSRHVILCTTTRESDEFNSELAKIAETYAFKIFRSEIPVSSNTQKPNPWNLFRFTLRGTGPTVQKRIISEEARDEIIRDSFVAVRTGYCIFVDGDTVAVEDLAKLVGVMRKKDYDIASVRVLASKNETVMEKLQGIEYQLAMDARKIYPWLTSGAAMVAKTAVISEIMSHHSLFFSGGDIEIGKLAKMLHYKVGHLAFVFLTDVPSTFKAWFRQRMAWFGGGFRHAIVNIHKFTWRHPMFYFYTTFLVYLLTPLRWYEVARYPLALVWIVCLYWFLIYAFHWRERQWYFVLFPFYALLQVMVLVPCGVYTYFKMSYHSQNPGFIRFRKEIGKRQRRQSDLNMLVFNTQTVISEDDPA